MPFLAALPAITAGAGLLGKLFGGAAQQSANQRGAENDHAAERNRLLAQLYGAKQNATTNALQGQSREQSDHANIDLDRRKFALDAPSVRAGQSVQGSILANAQPFKLSGLPDRISSRIPQMSGGLTPEMFSGDTRALGAELSRKALIDQLKGDQFDPLQKTDFSSGVLADPKLEEYQKSGLLEKVLAGLGMAGSVIGGIGEASDAYKKHRAKSVPMFDGEGI